MSKYGFELLSKNLDFKRIIKFMSITVKNCYFITFFLAWAVGAISYEMFGYENPLYTNTKHPTLRFSLLCSLVNLYRLMN